ncbi:hypothetical protein TSAR_000702, partial [Trichomalopsis sarcophagae]
SVQKCVTMVGGRHSLWLCALLIIGYSGCDSSPGNLRLELVQVVSAQRRTGKLQEYRLGEMLRKRYTEFLNRTYKPEHVYAYSSNFDRTKMSLQPVHASLFPPTPELTWRKDLYWMPIPIHYLPKKLDPFFYSHTCPK